MKLIIDIEPRYCKDMDSDIKELYYEAINHITEAVRNGIPYDDRPQGEWIKDTQGDTICSNCGFECLYSEDGFLYSLGRYCHHCGAKMNGDAKNETDN